MFFAKKWGKFALFSLSRKERIIVLFKNKIVKTITEIKYVKKVKVKNIEKDKNVNKM